MARLERTIIDVTAGQLSSRLRARLDFSRRHSGVEELLNFVVLPHGGMAKRSGTKYVAEVADSANPPRLIPFQYSTLQSYLLEFGVGYARFFTQDGQLVANDVTASITNGTFDSDASGWTDQSTGTASIDHNSTLNALDLTGASASVAIAEQELTITETSTNHIITFRIIADYSIDVVNFRIGTSSGDTDIYTRDFRPGWHSVEFDPDGNSTLYIQFRNSTERVNAIDDVIILDDEPLQIGSPYTASDLPALKTTQSADILYIASGAVRPYELQRFDTNDWSLVPHDFQDGPYEEVNDTSTTLDPNGTSGTVTVTASAVTGINNDTGFQSTDVGRLIRFKASTTWSWMQITAVASTTVCTAIIRGDDLTDQTADANWRLGSWHDGATGQWPEATTFHKSRLGWGTNIAHPQTIWASQAGDFNSQAPSDPDETVAADHALNSTIDDDEANPIHWMRSIARGLLIGTARGEHVLTKASTADPLGPDNKEISRQTKRGSSANDEPVVVDHAVLFIQRGSRVLREIRYSFENDALRTREISILAEDLLQAQVSRPTYQQNDNSIIWSITDDGDLLAFTYNNEQEVYAWSKGTLGGSFSSGSAVVEDCAVITYGAEDELWLMVKRTINGSTVRYIEYMTPPFRDADTSADAWFLDCALEYSGAATDTITGLDHLEGETVSVITSGATHSDVTVSSGSITLEREVTQAVVGLSYTSRLKTFPFEIVGEDMTTLGKTKTIPQAHILLYRTIGGSIGSTTDTVDTLLFRTPAMAMDGPVDLFTGTKSLTVSTRHELEVRLVFEHTDPLPCTLLGLVAEISFS